MRQSGSEAVRAQAREGEAELPSIPADLWFSSGSIDSMLLGNQEKQSESEMKEQVPSICESLKGKGG